MNPRTRRAALYAIGAIAIAASINALAHSYGDWFRLKLWERALEQAGMHDLRHAHASWLLADGAYLLKVKERLGHGSISRTEKYLHTLPDSDDAALDASATVRNRRRERSA